MGLAIINSTVHWGFEGYFKEYQLKIVLNRDPSITIVENNFIENISKTVISKDKTFFME